MHYNIIILDQAYQMYLDIAYMLISTFYKLNISYSLTQYNPNLINDTNNQCIFFGSEYYRVFIPKNSIITEFDCVDVAKNRLSLSLIRNNKIYSYSKHIIDYIHKLNPKSIAGIFHYGYVKQLDFRSNYLNCPKDIDICFVGNIEGRKAEIVTAIQKKFPDLKTFFGGYNPFLAGRERAEIYCRSRIVLSLYSAQHLFDYSAGSRIFPAVSTGAFVLAEKCKDIDQLLNLDKICINIEPDQLLDNIEYYLKNSEERERLRLDFYNNIKTMDCYLDPNCLLQD